LGGNRRIMPQGKHVFHRGDGQPIEGKPGSHNWMVLFKLFHNATLLSLEVSLSLV
jgi:hypothetical protein